MGQASALSPMLSLASKSLSFQHLLEHALSRSDKSVLINEIHRGRGRSVYSGTCLSDVSSRNNAFEAATGRAKNLFKGLK